MSDRDYYCAMKFRMMKIDMERKLTYHCDPAAPQNIDFEWLELNSGQLFNNPQVVNERQMMLENTRNSSCEQNCFKAEDVGAISPRILRQGYIKTHSDIIAEPEIIDLTLGSDCNLTCSYCLKEYSSAWRRDLLTNGNYDTVKIDDDRFTINVKDLVINRNSQPVRVNTNHFQLLLNETQILSKSLKTLVITGGEPLLNNSLFDILDKVSDVPDIKIFTGLGVDHKRFSKIVEKLKKYSNIRLSVSAESAEKIYEFNRYGAKWDDFVTKTNILEKSDIKFGFHSTLSNLTIIGLPKFYEIFKNKISSYDLVYNPDFMAVYVLDDHTKQRIIDNLNTLDISLSDWQHKSLSKKFIIQSMQAEPTQKQRDNIREFLKEFTRRRPDLDVTIYPKEFLDWMDYVV
jgi:MoaA/NifB/PqqE/SkfB family radical SAM enzyme